MKDNKKESWEIEFDKKFEFFEEIKDWGLQESISRKRSVKSFIRKVRGEAILSQLEKMEEELEGMEKKKTKTTEFTTWRGKSETIKWWEKETDPGYNQALSDIQAYIQKEKQLIKKGLNYEKTRHYNVGFYCAYKYINSYYSDRY